MSPISTWSRWYRHQATPIVVIALLVGSLALPLAKPAAADTGGYQISGIVTAPDGSGLSGINVGVGDVTNGNYIGVDGATSGADGSYMLGGLLAGSYKVTFEDRSGVYVDGFYSTSGFTADVDEATVVSVGPDITNINLTMPVGVHVSGRVTDPYGNGLPDMEVNINNGPGPGFHGGTGPNGNYSVAVLPGTYEVNVQDHTTGAYLQGCYGGGDFVRDDDCATVTIGTSDLTGIDVVMTLGAHIIGTVSDPNGNGLPDIQVTANPGNIVAWGTLDSGQGGPAVGWYALTLPSGNYTVSFHSRHGVYGDGCYAGGASGNFTTDPSACTPVTVGTSDVEIDVTMPFAGPHPLTITAPSGTMIYGGPVPALIPSYSGFVNGDTAASLTTQPTCTTTATSASPVATYPITCSGGVASNYSFTYVGGTLSVVIVDRYWTPAGVTLNVAAPGFLALTNVGTSTVVVSQPPKGKLTLGSTPGSFTYVPPSGWRGADSFSYKLQTGSQLSSPVTVTIFVLGSGMSCTGCNLSGLRPGAVSLTGANLTNANLTGTGLDHASLTGSNLSGATLAGASLTGATLTGANLSGANLTGAGLSSANLTGANLSGANLTKALVDHANLTGANLSRANLTGADLTGATLTGVAWAGATCPDGTGANSHGNTCIGHLSHLALSPSPMLAAAALAVEIKEADPIPLAV